MPRNSEWGLRSSHSENGSFQGAKDQCLSSLRKVSHKKPPGCSRAFTPTLPVCTERGQADLLSS